MCYSQVSVPKNDQFPPLPSREWNLELVTRPFQTRTLQKFILIVWATKGPTRRMGQENCWGLLRQNCFLQKPSSFSSSYLSINTKQKETKFIILPTYLGAKNICLGVSNVLPPEQTRYFSCYYTHRTNISVLGDYANTGALPSRLFNLPISAWYIFKLLHRFS